jgi:carboxylesterase type B
VTIFGESAGAVSVMALYLSPLSTGLFNAAIAQSGTMLMTRDVNNHSIKGFDFVLLFCII